MKSKTHYAVETSLQTGREWTAAKAAEFWPDQRGHWAPVSWKDHLHDFNVFYNGTILASPAGVGLNRNIRPEDQVFAAELRVLMTTAEPTTEGCDGSLHAGFYPDGRHVASWAPGPAPVYVIEHAMHNTPVYVEQRQFAHIPGGKPVRRGDEPHFLWVRLVVSDVIEIINSVSHVYCCLTLLKPSLVTGMGAFNNINFNFGFGFPAYPIPVHFDGGTDASTAAHLRHGPLARIDSHPYFYGNRNRLAIPAGQKNVGVRYLASKFFNSINEPLGHLVFKLPARVGAHADFVLPVCPVDDATMDRELALGYDRALAETERFWKKELRSDTSIRVSEPLVQGWIDNFPRLEAMIAEKHPVTGDYALPSGSYHYEATWPTPFALCSVALDYLGFGREVDKYSEVYRRNQGLLKPPSPYLEKHPGYIGSPRTFSAIDWITDHAAILWAAANHGLMTMDRDFIRRWEPAIVRACDFIQQARRNRKHPGYPGILPSAVANDCGSPSQTGWNDAWYHKALKTAAVLLERIGNRRGAEFRKEAQDYRRAFQKAYREVVAKSKKWVAPNGDRVPFIPPTLAEAKGFEAAHCFNLDTGACTLVFGELFPASDPIMQASLRWLREGPQVRHFRLFSSEFQPPVLVKEISSCEPCYSWNLFHTFELGDREKFSTGLYSLFAAGASRQNFVSCETRDAVFGNCFSHGLALMLLRMAVIHEEVNTLHLLKMAPLSMFGGEGFDWRNAPTWFGPVSIAGRYDEAKRTLNLTYRGPSRSRPEQTLLHLPPFENLARVVLNGKSLARTTGTVPLR